MICWVWKGTALAVPKQPPKLRVPNLRDQPLRDFATRHLRHFVHLRGGRLKKRMRPEPRSACARSCSVHHKSPPFAPSRSKQHLRPTSSDLLLSLDRGLVNPSTTRARAWCLRARLGCGGVQRLMFGRGEPSVAEDRERHGYDEPELVPTIGAGWTLRWPRGSTAAAVPRARLLRPNTASTGTAGPRRRTWRHDRPTKIERWPARCSR